MSSALERLRKARQGSGTSLASANITSGTTGTLSSGSSALARLRAARSGTSSRTSPAISNTAQTVNSGAAGTSALARLRAARSTPTLTPEAQRYASDEEKEKDVGGLLGGIGYIGEKITLGTVQGIEGIFDFLIGGAADLFGADEFAERQFANDWLNYSHADEWFNPSEGWKVAGDVGSGIGSSLPSIATAAAITYFTGGAGAGIGAALVAGTSAAGTATKEAYQETGKLTGKEWGYGILTGATEAAVEKISGGLGAGAGAIGKKIGQAFGKTAAKEVGKTTVKTVAVDLGKNFLSEAFEEGFSEPMAPQYKKITYDPNAKNATLGEIGYAALVGGLSGLVTSGAGTTVAQVGNIRKGAKAETSGSVGRIKAISEVVLEASGGKTDVQSVNAVRELYHDLTVGKLKITEGEKLTVKQKRALGELQTANMAAIFEPKMAEAAGNAVKNAEAVAERLNSYGNIKMADGKFAVISDVEQYKQDNKGVEVRDITAEDIRAGFDTKNGKQALTKAMRDNDLLRYVAASDVAGRLIMSVEQFEKTTLEGTNIKNQVDLNKFIEEASAEKRAALGRELGIADNEWDTLQLGRLNEAVRSYRESGKADSYQSRARAVNKAKSIDESAAKKKIPSVIRLGDGKVERYKTDKVDIAVYREGDSFTVYDYNENAPSRALSRAEVDSVLEQLKGADSAADVAKTLKTAENAELTNTDQGNVSVSGENSLSPSARMSKDESSSEKSSKKKISELKERIDAKNIESYARENIVDYDGLSTANQSMIRKVIREGRAHGLSEADVLSYARVAAHTGLNIEYGANMKDGDAGYFDPENNRIVVNPKTTKKQELILIHELDHALRAFRGNDGKIHYLVYKDADKKLSQETRDMIEKEYSDQDTDVSREELLADEASAYYTEAILGGKNTVDLLLGKEPSLAKKILNFFTGAARAYSGDEKLSKEARAHYRKFKKLFDSFAEFNKGRNAETTTEDIMASRKKSRSHGDTVDKSVRKSSDFEAKLADSIDLSDDNEIARLINANPGSNPHDVIKQYLVNEFVGKTFTLSDGRKAVMDKRDASKMSGYSSPKGVAQLSALRSLIEKAKFSRSAYDVDHPKFSAFHYYEATFKYKGEQYSVWLNVGVAKNDGKNHIYDITKKTEEALNQKIDSRPVGNAIENASSNPSISQSAEKSTASAKKVSENSAEGEKSIRKSKDITPKVAEESGIEESIGKLVEGKIESVMGRDAKVGARRASVLSNRRANMTVGQLRQMVARYTGEKVYTSKAARETIDNIYGIYSLSQKNRSKLYEALWQGYNACKTDNERAEFSYDMAVRDGNASLGVVGRESGQARYYGDAIKAEERYRTPDLQ